MVRWYIVLISLTLINFPHFVFLFFGKFLFLSKDSKLEDKTKNAILEDYWNSYFLSKNTIIIVLIIDRECNCKNLGKWDKQF